MWRRRGTRIVLGMAWLGLLVAARPAKAGDDPARGADVGSYQEEVAPILAKYCQGCHGGAKPKAGLDLAALGDADAHLKTWRKVLENVDSGVMPPPDEAQPTEEEAATLTRWLEARISTAACTGPLDPGRVTLRRLNRDEYDNTIRDLIGIDARLADDFPSDDVGYGFDNIGDVLTLPPILLEKYLDAAERIAERAIIADERLDPPLKHREVEKIKDEKAGGAPYNDLGRILATEGEIRTEFYPSREGDYLVRVRAFGHQAGGEPVKMAWRLDDEEVFRADVPATEDGPGTYEAKVRMPKGKRRFAVAFLNDFYDEKEPDPGRRDRNLIVDWIEFQGPVGDDQDLPESHRRIVSRRPKDGEDHRKAAREVLERFATRAFRRPAEPDEVERLVGLVAMAEKEGDRFERGIQVAVQAVLVSPHFLFRVELDRDAAGPHPINDWELASRLSYFLWSSMPDDELSRLAGQGGLHHPEVLDAQVTRMLKDPKARALVENFGGQWLQTRNLKTIGPDPGRFPRFDESLRSAMRREPELFFESIIKDDRSVLDFLDADYTFLNERLAKHYGIDGVKGDEFRRVELEGDRRGGILTMASVLTVTSNPTRTSPVKRGKWILEQVLGTPPPPPPPDVPELSEDKDVVLSGSLRQRMEQHRANPACASCHARMDPLGFGFENFDAVGAWRDRDGEFPIDPSGTLPNGQTFRGPKELKAILKARDKDFVRCLAEKMLTYALGRGLEYPDKCAVDRVVDGLSADGYRFSRLVREIVKSDAFRKRRGRGDER